MQVLEHEVLPAEQFTEDHADQDDRLADAQADPEADVRFRDEEARQREHPRHQREREHDEGGKVRLQFLERAETDLICFHREYRWFN